jgi:hypothetical protein
VSLGSVPDESECVVLEVVLELSEGPVSSLVDDLFGACKVEGFDTTNLQS